MQSAQIEGSAPREEGVTVPPETQLPETRANDHANPRPDAGRQANAGRQSNAGRLAVSRLMVTQYRNYESAVLDVPAMPIVLCGPNGAGKTNILEAISYLSPGRGLRGAKLADIGRRTGDIVGAWSVAATLETQSGSVKLGTGIEPRSASDDDDSTEGGNDRRVVRIDGETAKGPAALADFMRLIWLTPQMDRLFVEGASSRRRFLDRLVLGFDPDHGKRVSKYERVMRERSRLLRGGQADQTWLSALEAQMAEGSVAIAAARRDVVARLRGALAAGIGPFPSADMTVRGDAEDLLVDHSAVDVEASLRDQLSRSRGTDGERGRTRVGAHRADLEVIHLERQMPAGLCSTGEQKAVLIAIILADARLQAMQQGSPPIMLLDEIAAHLDEHRRAALVEEILDLGVQAWMTGTDRTLFAALEGRACFMNVVNGKVTPAND
ncbi:MAG: DNA replication/repair protein RecF [Alphaproteobacteria bacterium]|nr:MAG: DNA replication/repair protein RecF [Alphaproteobacteria bacterium]